MPDPSTPPNSGDAADPAASSPERPRQRRGGWPLWLRLGLAAVILSFVWSPFLAMLLRMGRIAPALQPTGSPPALDLNPAAPPPPKPGRPGSAP